jgi:hypothetical protein
MGCKYINNITKYVLKCLHIFRCAKRVRTVKALSEIKKQAHSALRCHFKGCVLQVTVNISNSSCMKCLPDQYEVRVQVASWDWDRPLLGVWSCRVPEAANECVTTGGFHATSSSNVSAVSPSPSPTTTPHRICIITQLPNRAHISSEVTPLRLLQNVDWYVT